MIGEELSAGSDLAYQSVSLCDDSVLLRDDSNNITLSNQTTIEKTFQIQPEPQVLNTTETVIVQDTEIVQTAEIELPNDASIEPILDDSHHDFFDNEEIEPENSEEGKKPRKNAQDFLNEPKAPLADAWEPLEPHEVVTISKPIRKGRRKRSNAPVTPNASKVKKTVTKSRGGDTPSTNQNTVKVSVPIEEFLIQELKKGSNLTNVIQASNIAPVFTDEAISELKKA